MNLTIIAATIVVIITASFLSSRNAVMPPNMDQSDKEEVLSEETEKPEATLPSVEATPEPSTPTPTSNIEINTSDQSEWKYPNSQVLSEGNLLILESPDETDPITDWYRSKVESKGYNVRSSVKTSANDNIKNVISAANGQSSINIEITKPQSGSTARIEIDLSSL